jgi:hypothetical protein
MDGKGWGSATGQYSLNLIEGRDMISILEMVNSVRDVFPQQRWVKSYTWKDATRTQLQTSQP